MKVLIILLALTSCATIEDKGIVVAKFSYGELFYVNIAERGAIVRCKVTKALHKQITIGERRSCD